MKYLDDALPITLVIRDRGVPVGGLRVKENRLLLVPFILAVEFALFGFRTQTGRESRRRILGTGVALV
ncbi:MAG: hypothetical protein M5U09_09400 [Gammaproteobacteria bacterium]|nr:hypothetical protein [Gammaproteobacteria bacterium]